VQNKECSYRLPYLAQRASARCRLCNATLAFTAFRRSHILLSMNYGRFVSIPSGIDESESRMEAIFILLCGGTIPCLASGAVFPSSPSWRGLKAGKHIPHCCYQSLTPPLTSLSLRDTQIAHLHRTNYGSACQTKA
jgi:hypothetical protein